MDGFYERLVEDGFCQNENVILFTGLGMPDVASQAFLFHMVVALELPVYGLADCNIYGIRILNCYANGPFVGTAMEGRGSCYAVKDMLWLGLRPLQVQHLLKGPRTFCNQAYRLLPRTVLLTLDDQENRTFVNLDNHMVYHPFFMDQHPARQEEHCNMDSAKVQLQALYHLGSSCVGSSPANVDPFSFYSLIDN
jgi:hypothetical protein